MIDLNIIKDIDQSHYMPVFNRQNICFTHGNKATLFDSNKKSYVDFFSGIAVNCLGYNHPKLNKAIADQAKKLIHTSNIFYNEPQALLAKELTNDNCFSRVFFANSGAEANEGAFKLIRRHFLNKGEKRFKIVSCLDSFHGRTLATLTATGQEKFQTPFKPLPEGFLHTPFNDLEKLKNIIAKDKTIAAVLLECVQGESGVKPASFEFLVGAYALCKSNGILFMLDEIQTGVGRTGKLFCFEHFGVQPDIITIGKGLAGGVPIGAILASGNVATSFKLGDHGSTFGGNPLACRAALVVLDELKNHNLLKSVEENGNFLLEQLSKFKKYNFVKDVRGLGLLCAIELESSVTNAEIMGKMLKKGFVIGTAGNNSLRFAPPFVITKGQITSMCTALEELFSSMNV